MITHHAINIPADEARSIAQIGTATRISALMTGASWTRQNRTNVARAALVILAASRAICLATVLKSILLSIMGINPPVLAVIILNFCLHSTMVFRSMMAYHWAPSLCAPNIPRWLRMPSSEWVILLGAQSVISSLHTAHTRVTFATRANTTLDIVSRSERVVDDSGVIITSKIVLHPSELSSARDTFTTHGLMCRAGMRESNRKPSIYRANTIRNMPPLAKYILNNCLVYLNWEWTATTLI